MLVSGGTIGTIALLSASPSPADSGLFEKLAVQAGERKARAGSLSGGEDQADIFQMLRQSGPSGVKSRWIIFVTLGVHGRASMPDRRGTRPVLAAGRTQELRRRASPSASAARFRAKDEIQRQFSIRAPLPQGPMWNVRACENRRKTPADWL